MPARIHQIERLFEEAVLPFDAPYGSIEEELDAVEGGRKAMAMYCWPRHEIEEGAENYLAVCQAALDRSLTIMHLPAQAGAVSMVRVYALRPEHAWRAQAHAALWEVYARDGSWSLQAENLEGFLLGYTDEQRHEWLAWYHWRRPAFGAATVYLAVEAEALPSFRVLGQRAVPAELHRVELLFAGAMLVRRDAYGLVPDGLTLARIAVTHEYRNEVFAGADSRVVSRVIGHGSIPALNAAMRSNLEFLTPSGWT